MFSFGNQGSAAPSPFGVPPPLPGSQPSGGMFGAATSTPTSTGLFGGSASVSPFGGQQFASATPASGGGLFGGAASTQPVGASSGGLFGSTPNSMTQQPGMFGSAPPASGGGMFGSSAPGGIFGSSSPAPGAATGGLFGSAPTAGGSTSLFGSSSAQPQPFGAPSASPFGGGAFGGQSTAISTSAGTSSTKYQPTRDTELNMKLVSITAMDAYKGKSFEELRWEDFQAGRAGGASVGSGIVGSTPMGGFSGGMTPGMAGTSTGSSLFGGNVGATPFGQTQQQQPSPFGAPAGGMFGSTTGQSTATGGLFGSNTPSSSSGGLFGSTAGPTAGTSTGGLFGSNTATTSSTGGGLFGGTSAGGGLFGSSNTTTNPSTGLFGSTNATGGATGGLFGSTTSSAPTGGLFGSTTGAAQPTGSLFGATNPSVPNTSTGGGLFGQSTPGGGLFGQQSQQQQQSTGTGLFGQQQPQQQQSTGLFGGATNTTSTGGGGLFGGGQSSSTSTGGLFGATNTTGGGLFGNTSTTAPSGGGLFGGTSGTTGTTGGLFGTTTTAPSGGLFGTTGITGATTGGPTTTGGLFGQPATTGGLFGSNTSGGLFGQPTGAPAGGLFSLSGSAPAGPPSGTTTSLFGVGVSSSAPAPTTAPTTPLPRPTGLITTKPMDRDSLSAFLWREKVSSETTTPIVRKKSVTTAAALSFVPANEGGDKTMGGDKSSVPSPVIMRPPTSPRKVVQIAPSSAIATPAHEELIVMKPRITYTTPTKPSANGRLSAELPVGAAKKPSALPVLSNHNIFTRPSIEAMKGMTDGELARVDHFQIGQYGVGSVTWPGVTDVRYLNIDEIILFKKGSVTLFPDESLKPPEGTGLNKTAVIELMVRPKNYELAKKHEDRYVSEMQKLTEKNGAEFLSYDLEIWRFRVNHFSTWGIDEMEWSLIDGGLGTSIFAKSKNDLSLFSKIETELFEEQKQMDTSVLQTPSMAATDRAGAESRLVGAMAVPPLSRAELIALGWTDLRVADLFLCQSFRATVGLNGEVLFPEHPVLYDTHKVAAVREVGHEQTTELTNLQVEKIINLLAVCEQKKCVHDAKNFAHSCVQSLVNEVDSEHAGLFTLIDAVLGAASESVLGGGPFSTAKFTQWLSSENAKILKKNYMHSASNPAALLSSHTYEMNASDMLCKMGHPRLALAAAAALDETARTIMRPQLKKCVNGKKSNDPVIDVYKALSGESAGLPDWRMQLAVSYWFASPDNGSELVGFSPPDNSLEWKIIKTVIKGDSGALYQFLDNADGEEIVLLAAAFYVTRLFGPALVSDLHYTKVITRCAEFLLERPDQFAWTSSVLVLSLLDRKYGYREKIITDIVARNGDKDMRHLVQLGIVDETFARETQNMYKSVVTSTK